MVVFGGGSGNGSVWWCGVGDSNGGVLWWLWR